MLAWLRSLRPDPLRRYDERVKQAWQAGEECALSDADRADILTRRPDLDWLFAPQDTALTEGETK